MGRAHLADQRRFGSVTRPWGDAAQSGPAGEHRRSRSEHALCDGARAEALIDGVGRHPVRVGRWWRQGMWRAHSCAILWWMSSWGPGSKSGLDRASA